MRSTPLLHLLILQPLLLVALAGQGQLQKIYLHPKAPGTERQSAIIDSLSFLPLAHKVSLSKGGNQYLMLATDHFLITDYPEKAIHVFTKEGAFVGTIDYGKADGLSPAYEAAGNRVVFYGDNKQFSLTRKDRIQIARDWARPGNRKYFRKYCVSLSDPQLALRPETPTGQDLLQTRPLYDGLSWSGQITTSSLYDDSIAYELKLYSGDQFLKGYFPYNPEDEPWYRYTQENLALTALGGKGHYLLTRPYCDTVYRMQGDSIVPAYQLVLPLENSLPASFFSKSFRNRTERENFMRNNGWMLRQPYIYEETPRQLYFAVRYLANFDTYVYNKQTGTTWKAKNIRADSSHYNVSVFGGQGLPRSGRRFYKLLRAGELVQFFEKHKSVPVPAPLERFLAGRPDAEAPVIVSFTFKD
ncbi:hypothetical protein [Flaviaesturariibacter amylovorans]|uniref:6-bladed beta-propeller n=1 Tax=Flaviaesturariibacter amylovorans TaxID=1084520 RepID=A0ABP8GRC2_9BACT